MKTEFRSVRLSRKNLERLDQINSIIEDYQDQGYVLTLRQLYYQLVSRDVIPNQQKEYAKLSTLLKEGRMGGIVDWDAIEDRLRQPYTLSSFSGPEEILAAATEQFQLPRQEGQDCYVEVWVEKDALSGVLKRVTSPFHIPILVNRGYSSASAMYDSYKRFDSAYNNGQSLRILYLGDFDPSGIDMIRDIESRISEFFIGWMVSPEECNDRVKDKGWMEHCANDFLLENGIDFKIIPIALTREQIEEYNPPPNPAKRSDPRSDKFISKHGGTSWEVDALKPEVLNQILTTAIEKHIDVSIYDEVVEREDEQRKKLKSLKQYL